MTAKRRRNQPTGRRAPSYIEGMPRSGTMSVTAETALRILIRRRNSPARLRVETRHLIRQAIARIHAVDLSHPKKRKNA
jgi:hypothetical protein